jgi:hypothetical protein
VIQHIASSLSSAKNKGVGSAKHFSCNSRHLLKPASFGEQRGSKGVDMLEGYGTGLFLNDFVAVNFA